MTEKPKSELTLFMEEFVTESDRAAVVLGAAQIDSLLYTLIEKYLLPHAGSDDDLLDGDSPLASFSAKIKICHRLGIIDGHFAKLLHILRKLRNAFAHEVSHSSLSSGPAKDRVRALCAPFLSSDFFQGLLEKVAEDMKRTPQDPGVAFRTVLALFHMRLSTMVLESKAIEPPADDHIVERTLKLKRPLPKAAKGKGDAAAS